MDSVEAEPYGVVVLDIHEGIWALWQVSVDGSKGPLRATATNAVVSRGFNESAFRSLSGDRQLLLTSRAEKECTVPLVVESVRFVPEAFTTMCVSWVDMLEDSFQAENLRRSTFNSDMARERKDARAAGAETKKYMRKSPLVGVDWPVPPPISAWKSDAGCTEAAVGEALRIANGCIRLINYWLDIEANRTHRGRSYFKGVGGNKVRAWPVPVNEEINA